MLNRKFHTLLNTLTYLSATLEDGRRMSPHFNHCHVVYHIYSPSVATQTPPSELLLLTKAGCPLLVAHVVLFLPSSVIRGALWSAPLLPGFSVSSKSVHLAWNQKEICVSSCFSVLDSQVATCVFAFVYNLVAWSLGLFLVVSIC